MGCEPGITALKQNVANGAAAILFVESPESKVLSVQNLRGIAVLRYFSHLKEVLPHH